MKLFDDLRKSSIIGFVQENPRHWRLRPVQQLATFHMDSQASWLGLAVSAGLVVLMLRLWRARKLLAIVCAIGAVVSAWGTYALYSYLDGQASDRDDRVKAVLADSPVKFKGFVDGDSETVRVEAMVVKGTSNPCKKGKKCVPCQALFGVDLNQSGHSWPLKRDDGSSPSKGCHLEGTDADSRYSEGSQKFYLNRIFVDPYMK